MAADFPPRIRRSRPSAEVLFALLLAAFLLPIAYAVGKLHWAAGAAVLVVALAGVAKALLDASALARSWERPEGPNAGPQFEEFEVALYAVEAVGSLRVVHLSVTRPPWGPNVEATTVRLCVPVCGDPIVLPFDPLLEPGAVGYQGDRIVGLRDPLRPTCIVFPRASDLHPLLPTPEQLARFREDLERARTDRAKRYEEVVRRLERGYVDAHSD